MELGELSAPRDTPVPALKRYIILLNIHKQLRAGICMTAVF